MLNFSKFRQATKGISMKWLLMGMATIPMSIVCIFLTVISLNTIRDSVKREARDGLKHTAVAVKASLNSLNNEEFRLDQDNNLWKGEYNITQNEAYIDAFTKGVDTEVTIFYGDTRCATTLTDANTKKRIIGTTISENISKPVLSGEEYSSFNTEINGENYYAYYIPLENPDGTIAGMVFVGESSAEIAAHIQSSTMSVTTVAIVCILLTNILCFFISKKIINAILAASDAVESLSKGNLSVDVDPMVLNRNDELGAMGHNIETLVKELRSIIGNLKESSKAVLSSGNELEAMASQSSHTSEGICLAVDEIAKGAISQAEDVESATHQISEMGNIISQIVDNIGQLNENSLVMHEEGNKSAEIMQELNTSNQLTTEAIQKIGKNVEATDHSVTQITEAVDLITDIASQTDLLSLNASIEAARAGEAGKGFAVVATQIQHLAQESGSSAQKITKIVEKLSGDSKNAMLVMEEVMERLQVQQDKLNETIAKFQNVRDGITISKEHTSQIHNQAQQCDSDRNKMVDIVQNLSAISEENAASTQETTASMEELNSTITLLSDAAMNLKELAVSLDESTKFFQF